MKKIALIIIVVSALFSSCHWGKDISSENLSYLYEKEMRPYIPEYTAFHKTTALQQSISDSIQALCFM